MYDVNIDNILKRKKFDFLFWAIPLCVGLLFLGIAGGFFASHKIKLSKMDSIADAKDVKVSEHIDSDGNTMYSPIYYYEVGGQEYTCSSGSSSSVYPKTTDVKVHYNSINPANCMTDYDINSDIILLIFGLIGFVVVIISAVIKTILRKSMNTRLTKIMELKEHGKLIKNLPYRLENTNNYVNGVPIKKIVVDYQLPTGSVITLSGDPLFNKQVMDSDGMADLLIDENNPDNYFIDFNINRISGNLPTDYYQSASTRAEESTVSSEQNIN